MIDDPDPRPPSARHRLLDAADRLFYLNGINSTGVDTVINTAGVARMTFYKHFGGKEGLILAYLEGREVRWRALLKRCVRTAGDDPRDRLLALFDALAEWTAAESRFRGCSFANAMAELADPDHPARNLITSYKLELHDQVLELARATDAAAPDLLADQLLLVYEGAIANRTFGNIEDAVQKALVTARQLVDEALREREAPPALR